MAAPNIELMCVLTKECSHVRTDGEKKTLSAAILEVKDLLIFETTEGNNHSWFVLQSILKSGWSL